MTGGRRVVLLGAIALVAAACGSPATPDGSTPPGLPDVGVPEILGGGDPWGPWRAQPITVGAAVRHAAEQACRTSMQPFPAAPLTVIDARGEGLLQATFANATGGEATCMDMVLNRDGTVLAMGGGSVGVGPMPARALAPLALESHGSMATGGPDDRLIRSVAGGRAGPGIAAVVIDVPGSGRMTASLANGWYLAWYPGAWPPGTTVRGLDITGSEVAETTP